MVGVGDVAVDNASAGQRMPFPVPHVRFDYDVMVPMSDGLGLHVNIFRPDDERPVPVLVTHGVYGKDVRWSEAGPYRRAWRMLLRRVPDMAEKSSLAFMRWEMPDPERWVPRGYAVIHADARGSGKTSGTLDVMSPREVEDYKELIEWAARQPWSNGRVGLMGISYYAITQWRVAALRPKGLAAIMPWEGAFDHYRDIAAHGGIPSRFFVRNWYRRQVVVNAYGNVRGGFKDAITGGPAAGAATGGAPASRRIDPIAWFSEHPLEDAYHRERTPDAASIEVPLLSVGNWGGAGLHLRGSIEGFVSARSRYKWLRLHSGDHFSPFYREHAQDMQRRFLDRFLKDENNGWDDEPPVAFVVRDPRGREATRTASGWPVACTRTLNLYLDGASGTLAAQPPRDATLSRYEWYSDGVTFKAEPQPSDVEIIGPLTVRLWVRPSRSDMDLFVVLRVLDPRGRDVSFEGANSPRQAIAQGWLRVSHREVDASRSLPNRPYHPHRVTLPVAAGETVCTEIEMWPTSVVVPKGYRIALTVLGRDFVFPGWRSVFASLASRFSRELPAMAAFVMQGSAPFLHDGRDPAVFGGPQQILSGGRYDSSVSIPVV